MRSLFESFFADLEINFTKNNLDTNSTKKFLEFVTAKNILPTYLPSGKYSGMVFHQSLVLDTEQISDPQKSSYLIVGQVTNDTGTTSTIHQVEGVLTIDFQNNTIHFVADPEDNPRVAKILRKNKENNFEQQYKIGNYFPHLDMSPPVHDPISKISILVMNFLPGITSDEAYEHLHEQSELSSRLDFINSFFVAYKKQIYEVGRIHGDLMSTGNFLHDFATQQTHFIDLEHSEERSKSNYVSDVSAFKIVINQSLQQLPDGELTQKHKEQVVHICERLRATMPESSEVDEATRQLEEQLPGLTRTNEIKTLFQTKICEALSNYESTFLAPKHSM